MGLLESISHLGREAARMVLPSPCVACGVELSWSARSGSCCAKCWSELPRIAHSRCLRCAMPWESEVRYDRFVCIDCQQLKSNLEWIDAWGRYKGGLESVLHALKFERHDFLADSLGGLLFEVFLQRRDFAFEAITAVPMHRRKLRERGYNQAELLAVALASRADMPYRGNLLRKTADRAPQSTLPRDARRSNVRDVFAAGTDCTGDSILLIDDICTTGETLQACARTLKRAGASRICALVVARA
ncbi:MAG: ComF family protein [Acidobacteriota bacterium]